MNTSSHPTLLGAEAPGLPVIGEASEPSAMARASLWQRLQCYPLSAREHHGSLLQRVRREYGWSEDFAFRAVHEYRCFCFLCVLEQGRCSPSPIVDAVWHVHLLDSKEYWLGFCPNALGFHLHHVPADGSRDHRESLDNQYHRTRALYREHFGEPSAYFWPQQPGPVARRLRPPLHWLRLRWFALSAWLASSSAWSQSTSFASNPLDWQGPQFLLLLIALLPVVAVLSLWLRRTARATEPASPGRLRPVEFGLLAGGEERAIDVLISELLAAGYVQPANAGSSRLEIKQHRPGPDLSREAAELLPFLSNDSEPGRLRLAMAPSFKLLTKDLTRRRLLLEPEQQRAAAMHGLWPWFAWQALLLSKLALGLQRERPVLFLVILALLVGVGMWVAWRSPPRTSRAADVLLKNELRSARDLARKNRAKGLTKERWPETVALIGISALAGTAFASYVHARTPSSSSDSSSSSSDSSSSSSDSSSGDGGSDSGGGSGCGGCGGGGD